MTRLDPAQQETSHRWPLFLPDGDHFVFMSRKPSKPRLALEVGSASGKERVRLVEADAGGRYAAGRLFFQRRTTLFVQPFETARNALSGEPKPVAEDAWLDIATDGLADFAIASEGRLAHRRGGMVTARLSWLGRDGKTLRSVGEPGLYTDPTLSPDQRRILVSSQSQDLAQMLLFDDGSSIGSVIRTRDNSMNLAIFSPDGSRILFTDDRNGPFDLFELKVSEPDKDVPVVVTPLWKYPETWSPDGRFIVYSEIDPASRANLWVLPKTGDAKPYPFLATPAAESAARFSPDGRFLAYTSDESGREEIFVQPFPRTGAKWQVSAAGGFETAWRDDGREIFYSTRFPADVSGGFAVVVRPRLRRAASALPDPAQARPRRYRAELCRVARRAALPGARTPSAAASSPIVVVLGPAAQGASKP